jgi:hypothetical protein
MQQSHRDERAALSKSRVIKDFISYINETEFLDLVTRFVLFRGQPVRGNLLPSIAREDPKVNPAHKEHQMLEQLQLLGASLLPSTQMAKMDLLILAQHYGLKTRLLDWTTNPLIALWFACSSNREGDAFVYALDAQQHLDANPYNKDPSTITKTQAFQPRFNNSRIVAQQGWFTIHTFSARTKRFVPLENNAAMMGDLEEFVIPADRRREILLSLDRHGVSARTVYPDLAGLCQYLNWRQ